MRRIAAIFLVIIGSHLNAFELNPEPPVPQPEVQINRLTWKYDTELALTLKEKYPKGSIVSKKISTHFEVVGEDGRRTYYGPYAEWDDAEVKALSALTFYDIESGKANGKQIAWHSNGRVRCIYNFIDGQQDADTTSWYENGICECDVLALKNGRGWSKRRTWHENGTMSSYDYVVFYDEADHIKMTIVDKELVFIRRIHRKKWDTEGVLLLDEMSLISKRVEPNIDYILLYEFGKKIKLEKSDWKNYKLLEEIFFE